MSKIKETAERIKNGENIYLIDLRSAFDFKDYHIDGSLNVPFSDVKRVQYMVPEKNAEIYFFCGSGHFSSSAATVLRYMGYTNVHDLGAM